MARKRLSIIFIFLGLILMSCNLSNLASNKSKIEEAVSPMKTAVSDIQSNETDQDQPKKDVDSVEPQKDETNEVDQPQNSGSQTACNHPYFPMRPGAFWVYKDTDKENYFIWEVDRVDGDLENATASMHIYVTDTDNPTEEQKKAATTIEYNWICSAEEGIVSFDMAKLNIFQDDSMGFQLNLENTEGDGVMIPPEKKIKPGYEWDLNLKGEFNSEDFGDTSGSFTSEDHYTIKSTDPVEFDGKTFDGFQFERNNQISLEIAVFGNIMTLPGFDFGLGTVTTLAKGVGYIKMDTNTEIGNVGQQLIRYYIP